MSYALERGGPQARPGLPRAVLEQVRSHKAEILAHLRRLCLLETPTDVPESQEEAHAVLSDVLHDLGYRVRMIRGRGCGRHLLAAPSERPHGHPIQLLVGHTDTVWPLGTLEEMPVKIQDGRLFGPGAFDMKSGVVLILFALKVVAELGLEPPATPVVFINSDEETGSPDSRRHVRRLARCARRAFVLEPSLGVEGKLKTARKGVGHFDVTIRGKAAHAGLDPASGASAILELSHVIQSLHSLNDEASGITVNVGVIDGGIRPNVVAPVASAGVDVRIANVQDGERIERLIHGLQPSVPGVSLQVRGGIKIPPLERTPRNRRLWEAARAAGADLGLSLDEAMAGGGSDGNTTSLYTATLDGLGAVGDGAHAEHEHVDIDGTVDRCALLALLLLAPLDDKVG
ncbi:MAG: M20 family metallopeptidase [Gemmatimonadota bacterium]